MEDFKLLQRLIKSELAYLQTDLNSGTSYQNEVLAKRDVFRTLENMIDRVIRQKKMREER